MKSLGIFRITSSDEKVRDFETHMSQGNFSFLLGVTDPHVLTNYWKRVLREMKKPLIPFKMYEAFSKIGETTGNLRTSSFEADE